MGSYYEDLGVSESAPKKEIREAYRTSLESFRSGSGSMSECDLRDVAVAYEILSDEELRDAYDKHLSAEVSNEDLHPGFDMSNLPGKFRPLDADLEEKVSSWDSHLLVAFYKNRCELPHFFSPDDPKLDVAALRSHYERKLEQLAQADTTINFLEDSLKDDAANFFGILSARLEDYSLGQEMLKTGLTREAVVSRRQKEREDRQEQFFASWKREEDKKKVFSTHERSRRAANFARRARWVSLFMAASVFLARWVYDTAAASLPSSIGTRVSGWETANGILPFSVLNSYFWVSLSGSLLLASAYFFAVTYFKVRIGRQLAFFHRAFLSLSTAAVMLLAGPVVPYLVVVSLLFAVAFYIFRILLTG